MVTPLRSALFQTLPTFPVFRQAVWNRNAISLFPRFQSSAINLQCLKGADDETMKNCKDLLIKNQYSVLEFPQASLTGNKEWFREILGTLSKNRKMFVQVTAIQFASSKYELISNPTANGMKKIGDCLNSKTSRPKELIVRDIDLSKPAIRNATIEELCRISHSNDLQISFS